jgi:hypothetical protein
MHIDEQQIHRAGAQKMEGGSQIAGKMTSESPPMQSFRQGMGALKTMANQEYFPPTECQLAPRKHWRV